MKANFGILPDFPIRIKKKERKAAYASRALETMKGFVDETTLDNYFRQYLDYLQYQRHYADKTIESYKRQIDHFKQFLIERIY